MQKQIFKVAGIKKIIAAILLASFFTSFFMLAPIKASTTSTRTKPSGKTYSSEWEFTVTYKKSGTIVGYMIFGYDTDYVNEDYVWTKSMEAYSTPKIKRGSYDSSYIEGSEKEKNTWSKLEVTHKKSTVYYRVVFSATYGTLTSSDTETKVKD